MKNNLSTNHLSMKLVCGLLVSFSSNIQAQNSDLKVQQIEVKAKSATENAQRDASAKTVVANAELTRFGDTSITDAMKRVPGVMVSNGALQLMGMSAQYTQILLDGEPLRGTNIEHIPMSMIDRVEIYRLGSAEFSSAAIAGTINIILKKIPREAQQQIKLSVSDAYLPATKLDWRGSETRDKVSYALSIAAGIDRNAFGPPKYSSIVVRDLNKVIVNEYETRFESKFKSKMISIYPKIQYKEPDGFTIALDSGFVFYNFPVEIVEDYKFLKGEALPVAHEKVRVNDYSKSVYSTLRIGDRIWQDVKLDLTLGVNGDHTKNDLNQLQFAQDATLVLNRDVNRVRRSGGLDSTLKLSVSAFENHDIVSGWNGSTDVVNERSISLDSQAGSNGTSVNLANDQITRSVVSRLALFVQDDWRFQKNSSASMGLRWETVRVETEGNQLLPGQFSANVWSPIVQTLWQLPQLNSENKDRIRIGVARSYKAPNNFQLVQPSFKLINNSIENPNELANPRLRPELAWSFETAYEHNGADKWNYNVRAVLRKIDDLHRQDIIKIGDDWWKQYVNAGHAISKNISVETQFPLTRFIANAPELNVSFAVSKSWTSVSNLPQPDNRLTPITFTANSNINYTAKDLPLSLGASLRYRDGHPLLLSLSQRQLHQAQTNLDVYGVWKFDKKTQLRLTIDNVLKRAYANGFEFYQRNLTTSKIERKAAYRMLRLNFEHNF
jgi:outer membrane receptor for ferrienterochelin and colicins